MEILLSAMLAKILFKKGIQNDYESREYIHDFVMKIKGCNKKEIMYLFTLLLSTNKVFICGTFSQSLD